jgi:hypothetical protein
VKKNDWSVISLASEALFEFRGATGPTRTAVGVPTLVTRGKRLFDGSSAADAQFSNNPAVYFNDPCGFNFVGFEPRHHRFTVFAYRGMNPRRFVATGTASLGSSGAEPKYTLAPYADRNTATGTVDVAVFLDSNATHTMIYIIGSNCIRIKLLVRHTYVFRINRPISRVNRANIDRVSHIFGGQIVCIGELSVESLRKSGHRIIVQWLIWCMSQTSNRNCESAVITPTIFS